MNARRLVPLVLVAIVACGFPDVSYDTGDGGEGGADATGADAPNDATMGADGDTGGGPDGSHDGEASTDTGSDGNPNPDEASVDAPVDTSPDVEKDTSTDTSTVDSGPDATQDASADAPKDAPADVAPDQGCTVDNDHDGYFAASCGGNDCCDTDSNAHPNQATYFTSQDACSSWDYNCDTTIEYEYLSMITCSGGSLLGCSGGPGFAGNPACGLTAPYSVCTPTGLTSCAPSTTSMTAQGCH